MPTRRQLADQYLPTLFMVEDVAPDDPVAVVAANIQGTAFVVDEPDGWLATAKHVVDGLAAADIRVRSVFSRGAPLLYGLGTHRTVQRIVPHPDRDIALLKVAPQATAGRPVTFAGGTLSVGEDVILIGFASGTDYVYCDELLGDRSPKSPTPLVVHGITAALVPHDGRPLELYVTDLTTVGGNSGGPTIGVESGDIVALHIGGADHNGYGYALPIHLVLDFLAETKAAI